MSIAAYQGKKFLGDVATNRGWRKFADHVLQRLDPETVPNLWHVAEYGWTENIAETEQELQRILDDKLYLDPAMKTTTSGLLSLVNRMRRDATLVVSDGFS